MKRTFSKTIAIFLSLAGISVAESRETRSDGKVNIGGILYPEEEMKDPERRRKAELVAEQVAKMKKNDQKPRDYTSTPTSELLAMALDTMSNNSWDAALEELSKRPDEMKAAVDEFLENDKPYYADILFFSRLPAVAKVFGAEYHVEVVKKILDHPLAKKYDEVLLEDKTSSMVGGGLLDHLAASGKDETQTLDKLITEGRIERGSEMETKWRKRLSGGERKEKDRPEKNDTQDARTGDRKKGAIPSGKADSESSSDLSYLVAGGVIVLLGILAILFKIWKGRSQR